MCARPVVTRIGRSLLLGVTVIVVTAVQPWLPPVGTAGGALAGSGLPPLPATLLGLVLAGAAATVGWLVDRRR